ncbi:MAG TPA: amino acid ABC transporter permease [Solirubrobacteraceae bacterium]|nr:amino acid ABC transporter permease [Solirubrobacteraceae bacterium]
MATSKLTEERPTGRPEDIKAVPVRHPGRWIVAAIVLVVAASIVRSIITGAGSKAVPNTGFQWHYVGQYLFDSRILHGVVATIYVTFLAMVIGILLGVIAAIMRLSPNPIVSGASWLYIWFFRGTPLLVQIIFWYNLQALFPTISLGIPFGPAFVHTHANAVITPLVAGLLALGLNEGAYMSEIVRAGIISVDEGQTQAAQSLGMSRLQVMRLIVLPQAMRVIIPPTGNETISMLKNTALLSVISFGELLFGAQTIYDVNYKVIPLLIVASIWYLVMTSVLYVGQYFIERRYGRGFSRAQRASMRARWLSIGGGSKQQ